MTHEEDLDGHHIPRCVGCRIDAFLARDGGTAWANEIAALRLRVAALEEALRDVCEWPCNESIGRGRKARAAAREDALLARDGGKVDCQGSPETAAAVGAAREGPAGSLSEALRLLRAMLPAYCPACSESCVEATCLEARELLARGGGAAPTPPAP